MKELEHWFGERANQMEIVASGNLPYNMAILAREGIGVLLTVKLRCIYEGLLLYSSVAAHRIRHGAGLEKSGNHSSGAECFGQLH